MKLITFAVPCYNSASYMDRCLASLLTAGEDAEIILIDDGSTDETGAIADQYAKDYPEIIRVIHQENGGHGEGVNQGLAHATGRYYKVVDSDDWLDPKSLKRTIGLMKEHLFLGQTVDLYVVNFVYEHLEEGTRHVVKNKKAFYERKVTGWDGIKGFDPSHYMIMHSLIYRTEVLKASGLKLPKHTFYVDNIVAYQPLPYVKTLCYLDEDLYRYYIGRPDQSVQESVMIKRLDQQILVTKLMLQCCSYADLQKMDRKLRSYMINFMSKILCISSILPAISGEQEHLNKRRLLWQELKYYDPEMYRVMRRQVVCIGTNLPGKAGRKVSVFLYHLAHKIWKFN